MDVEGYSRAQTKAVERVRFTDGARSLPRLPDSHRARGHHGFQEQWWVPWLLVLSDIVSLQLALCLGYLSRLLFTPLLPITIDPSQMQGLLIGLLLIPLGYYFMGLYPGYGTSPVEHFRRRSSVTFLGFAALLSWGYMFGDEGWPRGIILLSFCFALVVPVVLRFLLREWLDRRGYWGMPVVIIGATGQGRMIAEALNHESSLGLVPVGYFDDRRSQREQEVGGSLVRSLEESRGLTRTVRVAILAMPRIGQERLTQLVRGLPFPRVILVPDFFGLQHLWVTSMDLGGGVLGLEIKRNLLIKRNRVAKRLLDYLLVLPIAIVSLPLIAVLALWVRLVSPGSPFYFQSREGCDGKEIKVWKLRTMYADAEARLEKALTESPALRAEWSRFFKLKDDPRILPGIGQFLRRTSLDELPQVWNVIRGDMSLVGPRPFPLYHLENFDPEFRKLRHSVMPGITGLWQVSSRSDGDLEAQEGLDSFYIRNWSPWLDIYLLFRTPWAVLFAKGAY